MSDLEQDFPERGLIQIFEDILEELRTLSKEVYATRQVLRYWMDAVVQKETPINVDVKVPGISELAEEIEKTKKMAVALRR